MTDGAVDAVLDSILEPLTVFMRKRDLIEIQAIRPGEVILEIEGKGYVVERAPNLTMGTWERIFHALANKAGQEFDPIRQPRVSVRLPGGHRFEGMAGKTVGSGLSVTIRMLRKVSRTLEDFGVSGEIKAAIEDAIRSEANVIISGGTKSGKTTLTNLLLPLIPAEDRILTAEDTQELFPPHRNQVNYIVSRNEKDPVIGYSELIDHFMRSSPTRVILGELSMLNAFPCLLMLNTGHRGLIATMHADSCRFALDEGFYQRVTLAGHRAIKADLAEFLRTAVDLVIQVAKVGRDARRVTELWWPARGEPVRLWKHGVEVAP